MTEVVYPDATTEQYTYNSDSEPLTYTNANGETTSYTYDGHGNNTVIQDPLNDLTTMTYTTTGQVQTSTDANNHTTTYQYDSQDRLTTVSVPRRDHGPIRLQQPGRRDQVHRRAGNATTYSLRRPEPRDRHRPMPWAIITTITYDADGNVTKVQAPTPAGQTARTTIYAYDSMDRLTTVTDPLG